MIDQRVWRHFDWTLFTIVIVLSLIGIAMIYSATLTAPDPELEDVWVRQIAFLGIGIVVLFAIAALDYRSMEVLALPAFLVFVALLVVVALFGEDQGGTQAWISVGGTLVQPTEAGKFLLVIFFAWYLSWFYDRMSTLFYLLVALALLLAPLYLVITQPDFGMTITYAFIGGVLILAGGVQIWQVFFMGSVAVAGVVAALVLMVNSLPSNWEFTDLTIPSNARICQVVQSSQEIEQGLEMNNMQQSVCRILINLQDNKVYGYMLNRILIFLEPDTDQATNFNVEQATIAVGAGGWLGKGWTHGSQNQLRFLRVRHTDFIFSVIAEEFGLIGAAFVACLSLIVVWRLLRIADLARDQFGRLIAIGVAAIVFFQVFINIGFNLSILPVTGLTLPFVSYGGSSLLSMMAAIGLAESVSMRHRKMEFQ
ncbi:MAG: FtsW/RodA/SpoVE family cell cycle protein [Caldilineaceae bacterium]